MRIDRLLRRTKEPEIGPLADEYQASRQLIDELAAGGNDHARYVLSLRDDGRLPFSYVPKPISDGGTWKAVALVGQGANYEGETGIAFVFIINGLLVNKRRIERHKVDVLRDMEDGMSDVARGLKSGYLSGRIAIAYPYEQATQILEMNGVIKPLS